MSNCLRLPEVHPQYRWTFPPKGNASSTVKKLLVSGPDSSLRRDEQNDTSADGGREGQYQFSSKIITSDPNSSIDHRARFNNSTESSSLLAEPTISTNSLHNCGAIVVTSLFLLLSFAELRR